MERSASNDLVNQDIQRRKRREAKQLLGIHEIEGIEEPSNYEHLTNKPTQRQIVPKEKKVKSIPAAKRQVSSDLKVEENIIEFKIPDLRELHPTIDKMSVKNIAANEQNLRELHDMYVDIASVSDQLKVQALGQAYETTHFLNKIDRHKKTNANFLHRQEKYNQALEAKRKTDEEMKQIMKGLSLK